MFVRPYLVSPNIFHLFFLPMIFFIPWRIVEDRVTSLNVCSTRIYHLSADAFRWFPVAEHFCPFVQIFPPKAVTRHFATHLLLVKASEWPGPLDLYDSLVRQACVRRLRRAAWRQHRRTPNVGTSPLSQDPPCPSCQGERPPSTPRPAGRTTPSPRATTTSSQTKPQSNQLPNFGTKLTHWIVASTPPSILSPALFCPAVPHLAPYHPPPCPYLTSQPCPWPCLTSTSCPRPCPCSTSTLCPRPCPCSTPLPANCPPIPDPPALQTASKAGYGNLLSYRLCRALFYIHAT